MKNLEALCCTISPRAGGQSISKATPIPFVIHSTRDGLTRNGNYSRAPPPGTNRIRQFNYIVQCFHLSVESCGYILVFSSIRQLPSLFLIYNGSMGACWHLISSSSLISTNLVPRLFPPPVFDHFRYTNTEGEGLGDLVMCCYIR